MSRIFVIFSITLVKLEIALTLQNSWNDLQFGMEGVLYKGYLHFFSEIQVGTLHQERNLFLFSLEHHAFFGQPESSAIIVVYCFLF